MNTPVTLVVPCFNEAGRIIPSEYAAALSSMPWLRLCLVDDGSRDATAAVLERIRQGCPDRVEVLGLAGNRGKAEAVRQGILAVVATGPEGWVGFWDADLATPFAELPRMLAMAGRDCDLVMGTRVVRLGAHVQRRWWRHLPARMMAGMVRQVVGAPVHDSQCGAKLMRAGLAAELVDSAFSSRWLFDVELLLRLRGLRGRAWHGGVVEVPLERWRDVRGSKLRVRDALQAPWILCWLGWRYRR